MWATIIELLLSWSNTVVPFGATLLVHSSIIIAIGLFGKHLLRNKGTAVQSVFLRVCLVAVIFTPLSSLLFSFGGIKIPIPAVSLDKREHVESAVQSNQNQQPATFQEKQQNDIGTTSIVREQEDISLTPRIEKTTPEIQPMLGETSPVPDNTEETVSLPPLSKEKITPVVNQETSKATPVVRSNIYAGFYIVFTVTWIAFSLFFFTRAVVVYLFLCKLIHSSVDAKPKYKKTCAAISHEMGIAVPRVLQNPAVQCTFLAGFLHPVIVLPAGEHQTTMATREVFIHEIAHLARYDHIWNWFAQIVKIILPIQPLLWILARKTEEASEYVCDDYVVNHNNNGQLYAVQLHTMIQSMQSRLTEMASGASILSVKTPLLKRIERIIDKKTPRNLTAKLHEIVSIIVIFCFSIVLTGFIRIKNYSLIHKSEKHETSDRKKTDNTSDKEYIAESDFDSHSDVEDTINIEEEIAPEINDEKIENTEIAVENTLESTGQIPQETESVVLEQFSESQPTENEKEHPDSGLIASAEKFFKETNLFEDSSIKANESVNHISEIISGKESGLSAESEKDVNQAQTEEQDIADTKTENSSGSIFNASNAMIDVSGFRDNRIKMPVAKAVNVTVKEGYENFDIRNENERRDYSLYYGLDKLKNEPAWSPDGKWIAFVDRSRIWVVSPAGGEPKLLYENFHEDFSVGRIESLCFTPDSNEINFKKDIYDVNRGSVVEIKNDGFSRSATFSKPIPNIASVNIQTGEQRVIIKDGYNFCTSPDGRYICFLSWGSRFNSDGAKIGNHGSPVIFDTKTGETRFLADDEKEYGKPAFSPDGLYIIIPARENYGPSEFYKIFIDGTKTEQLTFYDENDDYGKAQNFPEFSPDGKWILYTDYSLSDDNIDSRLFLYSTITGERFKFFQNPESRNSLGKWSPDGEKICYLVQSNDGNYIYISDFISENYELKKPVANENTFPTSFELRQNYPNPFNQNTTIEFSLPESGSVNLVIYNIMGQKVRELVSDIMEPGVHSTVWDGRDEYGNEVASGMYISQLIMGNKITNVKMSLMK
ncbi:M56 family metallopeptidase [Candidatus Latescibacterota bacterium]